MPYILEVQQYRDHAFFHIGYMDKVFETPQCACDYYDTYNPHMRSLFYLNTWRSDLDLTTNYRFVVREYDGEELSICPFHKNYAPDVTHISDTYLNRVIEMSTQKLDRNTIYDRS